MIWMAHKTNTRPNLDSTLSALMDNAYRGSLREQRSFVGPFHSQEYNSILKERNFYYDSTIRMYSVHLRTFYFNGHTLGCYPQTLEV